MNNERITKPGTHWPLVSILVPVMVLGVFTPTSAGQEITDPGVTEAIEDEFLFDRAVDLNDVDISTNEGVVTLTGTVDNLLEKERAARIAETVKGVRGVVNRLEVESPVQKPDTSIEADVRNALLTDPAADSYEITVDVDNGVATLSGVVESWQEQELAKKVAKSVSGVTAIDDDIDVEYETERPDAEIRAEIEQALRWNVLVDHGLIDVAVEDGEVTLSGTVGSASEKTQARADAWVAGVESVEAEDLEVERWARDEDLRKDKYTVKNDAEIEQAIEDAMLYDPRVYSFNVDPMVNAGVATLRGTVDNVKAKRAAAQDARNVVGVLRVKNRIKLEPVDERSDEAIEDDIRDALARDVYTESYEVGVNVVNGVAYLSGTVDSYFEKAQADDVAARVNGVVSVVNNITVDAIYEPYVYDPYVDDWYLYDYDWYDYEPPYTAQPDWEIKDDIEDELWWSPFVDSDEVTVTVDDGVANLTGVVDTWSEYWAARENAIEGGAAWVDNDLVVE